MEGDIEGGERTPGSTEDLNEQLPPENQELLESILELASSPEADRSRLYAALIGARFLLPLSKPAPEAPTSPDQPGEVTVDVLTVTGPNGEMALPVFTHEGSIQQWTAGEAPPTLPVLGQDVFRLTAASPIQTVMVNPAGPFGGHVGRAEIEAMAEGMIPQPAPAFPTADPDAPAPVYIDVPLVPPPTESMELLISVLERNAAVRSAHLFLMQVGEGTAPRLTLGLHVQGAAGQWVIPQLTRVLQKEDLSFEPYEKPDLLGLDDLPGGESIGLQVPAIFAREPNEMPESVLSENARETTGTADTTGDSAVEYQEDEVEEERPDLAPPPDATQPARRSLWPFRKKI